MKRDVRCFSLQIVMENKNVSDVSIRDFNQETFTKIKKKDLIRQIYKTIFNL